MRYVLDQAQAGAAQPQLMLAAGLFLLFGLIQAGITLLTNYLGTDVSWDATNRLHADLALHCLRLDMAFHNRHTPGELIARVDGDVGNLAELFSQMVLRILANGLLVVGVVIMLWREDWRMGLAATLYAALVVMVLQLVQSRTVKLWTRVSETDATLGSLLEERLGGREDIRANGGEGYVLRRLALAQAERFQAVYPALRFGVFTFAANQLLFTVALVLAFGIGIALFLAGRATIGTVYLIAYYVGLLQSPLGDFRHLMGKFQEASASVGRIQELWQQQPTVTTSADEGRAALAEGALAVAFDHLSFHYAGQNGSIGPVLQDLSFCVPAGRVLGLIGRTGSGKTTVTRLLFRLYEPDAGNIQLGGTPIHALSLRDLRQRVGMVTQDVQLFAGSLRDNITLFNPRVDDDAILAALSELGLWSWYLAQPNGLDTVLEGSGGLSAGEAQLLAFVRIFLKDPGLVILDEASSRLDPATEALLERAIDRLLRGRTAIIIAHRLETLARADDILILDGGRTVELGPRAALALDADSRFYHLLQHGLQETLA